MYLLGEQLSLPDIYSHGPSNHCKHKIVKIWCRLEGPLKTNYILYAGSADLDLDRIFDLLIVTMTFTWSSTHIMCGSQ